jgi:hypothetical protein
MMEPLHREQFPLNPTFKGPGGTIRFLLGSRAER